MKQLPATVQQLEDGDALAHLRAQFILQSDVIYLDGNSLGPLSTKVTERLNQVMRDQWGKDLIKSWNQHDWIGMPQRVGNRIGELIGAAAGQTLCCDSISVNLFKVLSAALQLFDGQTIVSTNDNFPTDLYMVQGLAQWCASRDVTLKLVAEHELLDAINDDTAVVLVTHVNFRTGAVLDIEALQQRAQQHQAALMIDLAHSAGALPLQLDSWGVDFAVGCTYKYLNAGPGAPAFLYVAKRHIGQAVQPLYGWMGHAAPFSFNPEYQPASDITQYLTGTPSILAMAAVDAALDVFEFTDMASIRAKSIALGELFAAEIKRRGLDSELSLISPQSPQQRGSQISYAHEHAYAICQALIAAGVIGDFRAPNVLRIGFAPLYVSFSDVIRALDQLEHIMGEKIYLQQRFRVQHKVT